MDYSEFQKKVETIQQNSNLELKDPKTLTYAEKHAVRHMRHLRDEEYGRLAWKACGEYSQRYTKCYDENGFLAPFKCQEQIEDLHICVNRHIIRLREAAPEIVSVPKEAPEFIDWNDSAKIEEFNRKHGLKK